MSAKAKKSREVLLIKPFSYNRSISDVSAGLNNSRQRDFVKVKAKTSIFIENLTRVYPGSEVLDMKGSERGWGPLAE